MAKNKNLKLFREYATVSAIKKLSDERLSEQTGAVSAWSTAIWNIGKLNLNGRVYTKDLAERLVKENRATIVYDSHSHNWGEAYLAAVAVARNPRIEGDQLWVDIFFVDEDYSKKIQAIFDGGVSVGVSSVGYGETDKDGVVVTSTYELVRYLDFVTDPANETYAAPKEEPTEKSESVEDSEGVPTDEQREVSLQEKRIEILKRIEHMLD